MKVIFYIAVIILLFGCRKNLNNYQNTNQTFADVFNTFFNSMNKNYVFWDVDTTNWDRMYKKYSPIFDSLNINNPQDVKKSVDYFREMTSGMVDGHYQIRFINASIKDSFLYPFLDRKILNKIHIPFAYNLIDTQYFDSGYVSGNYINTNNEVVNAVSATIKNKFVYFSCNKFYLSEAYKSTKNNLVRVAIENFIQKINNISPTIKGIIIDVRNNVGGNIADLNFFLGKLVKKTTLIGSCRTKSDLGRLDYIPWIDVNVVSDNSVKKNDLPIYILTDAYTASLSEIFAMSIHALPNGKVIGEKTWGATGPIIDETIFNDGPFIIPNFLSVYTSSVEFKYLDGKMYEGLGFPPDVEIPFNIDLLNKKIDPSIDYIISRF